jgi:hypothetical protein
VEAKKGRKPGVNFIKLFSSPMTKRSNKLERFSLASLPSWSNYFMVKPETYPRGEHLQIALLE